jgi:hypothetical protein
MRVCCTERITYSIPLFVSRSNALGVYVRRAERTGYWRYSALNLGNLDRIFAGFQVFFRPLRLADYLRNWVSSFRSPYLLNRFFSYPKVPKCETYCCHPV